MSGFPQDDTDQAATTLIQLMAMFMFLAGLVYAVNHIRVILMGAALVAVVFLIGYGVYANRKALAGSIGRALLDGWQQRSDSRRLARLRSERNAASRTIDQLRQDAVSRYPGIEEPLRDMGEPVEAQSPQDVETWLADRQDTIQRATREAASDEAVSGPDRRGEAREEARHVFEDNRGILVRYFSPQQVEIYLDRRMHDRLPSHEVVAAGQNLLDRFQRQLAVHNIAEAYREREELLVGQGFDQTWLRRHLSDSFGTHRSLAAVQEAEETLLRLLPRLARVPSDSKTDIEQLATDMIDQEIARLKLSVPEDERRQWIAAKVAYLREQNNHP